MTHPLEVKSKLSVGRYIFPIKAGSTSLLAFLGSNIIRIDLFPPYTFKTGGEQGPLHHSMLQITETSSKLLLLFFLKYFFEKGFCWP